MRDKDVSESYELGCNAYLIKAIEPIRCIEALREVAAYWFGTTVLPND